MQILKRFDIMKKLLIGFVLCMISFIGMGWDDNDSTLLWMVNDSAIVDGQSMHYSFLTPYIEDYDNWNGIRIKVVSSDGSIQRIIDNWGEDEYGNTILVDGKEGMPFDDSSGYWGCWFTVRDSVTLIKYRFFDSGRILHSSRTWQIVMEL